MKLVLRNSDSPNSINKSEFKHYLFFSGVLSRNQIKCKKDITLRKKLSFWWLGWERTNSWQSADYSLYFKANDDKLNFDNTDYLANANDNYSGGLFFSR